MLSARPHLVALTALHFLVLTASSCTPSTTPQPAPRLADTTPPIVALPAPAPRDDGRLPSTTRPVSYDLSLVVDPSQQGYSGKVKIAIELTEAVGAIVLHGNGLDVQQAVLLREGLAAALTVSSRAPGGQVDTDELVLTSPMTLPAGSATLELTFRAPFSAGLRGLYKMQDAGLDYAFTQFEPTDARRAFPCFDEPGFKTPITLTIDTPKGLIAIANAPERSRETIDGGATTRFTFEPTPPIPTYLVAFGVGQLDVLESKGTRPSIRVVATKGKAQRGAMALARSQELLAKLEAYFGIAYPYAKLDVVAVPEFSAGAMENPGFVTFREELVLLDPARATLNDRRRMDAVVTHEFAHQWFGNLVTARWWDDLWLNEGFATWAESKGLPEAAAEAVNDKMGVMETDVLASARAVRQPVRNNAEALEAFDGVTYVKGASILAMLEAFAGPKKFQDGVQKYLRTNANRNASASDFLSTLDTSTGQPITKIASSFLDRTGVPLVSAEVRCDGSPRVHLSQKPFPRRGNAQSAGSQWVVPVCVVVGEPRREVCTLLDTTEKDLPIDGGCPTWAFPNADEHGYFRYALGASGLQKLELARGKLTTSERIGLVGNEWALARGGIEAISEVIRVLRMVASDSGEPEKNASKAHVVPATKKSVVLRDRHVVEAMTNVISSLGEDLVDADTRASFNTLVSDLFSPTYVHLGWGADGLAQTAVGRSEASDDLTTVREKVILALAFHADDANILKQATVRADAYLKGDKRVSQDNGRLALKIAARRGDRALFDAIEKLALHGETAQDRTAALSALGAFENPELLRRALDLTLTDGVKIQDVRYVYGSAFNRRVTQNTVIAWLKDNFEKVKTRLPDYMVGRFSDLIARSCTADELRQRDELLTPKIKGIEGSERDLLLAKDAAASCIDLRSRESSRLKDALKR